MKDLRTILQNAVEDYLVALNRPTTLADAAEVCSFNLSDVFWHAASQAQETLDANKPKSRTINGVKQSHAREILSQCAQNLFDNTVVSKYGTLKQLFKDAETYGFNFRFATRDAKGWHETLPPYTESDVRIITAYALTQK